MASSVGTRIGESRRKKGMTQDQLAEYMGVTSQAVSKWENDLSCPDIALLPQLADCFEVSIDWIVRGDTENAVRMIPEGERKDFNAMLLKVRVNSADGDIVRVNLPLSLVKVGLEIGVQLPQITGNEALKDIDFQAVLLAAQSGVTGKLVEVETADGDQVEITIE